MSESVQPAEQFRCNVCGSVGYICGRICVVCEEGTIVGRSAPTVSTADLTALEEQVERGTAIAVETKQLVESLLPTVGAAEEAATKARTMLRAQRKAIESLTLALADTTTGVGMVKTSLGSLTTSFGGVEKQLEVLRTEVEAAKTSVEETKTQFTESSVTLHSAVSQAQANALTVASNTKTLDGNSNELTAMRQLLEAADQSRESRDISLYSNQSALIRQEQLMSRALTRSNVAIMMTGATLILLFVLLAIMLSSMGIAKTDVFKPVLDDLKCESLILDRARTLGTQDDAKMRTLADSVTAHKRALKPSNDGDVETMAALSILAPRMSQADFGFVMLQAGYSPCTVLEGAEQYVQWRGMRHSLIEKLRSAPTAESAQVACKSALGEGAGVCAKMSEISAANALEWATAE